MSCVVGVWCDESQSGAIATDSAMECSFADGSSLVRTAKTRKLWRPNDSTIIAAVGNWLDVSVLRDVTCGKRELEALLRGTAEFVTIYRESLAVYREKNTTEGAAAIVLSADVGMFEFGSDFTRVQYESGRYAIGSGCEFALGALFVMNGYTGMSLAGQASRAVKAAAEYSPTVREPVIVDGLSSPQS